jgi:hypothetical protein
MASPTVIEEDGFQVAQVEAVGGPSGAVAAFDRLEEAMRTLRGQKIYGVFYPGNIPDISPVCG